MKHLLSVLLLCAFLTAAGLLASLTGQPLRLMDTAPLAPTGLAITGGINNTYAHLTWNPVSEAVSYQVWQDSHPFFASAGDPLVAVAVPVYLDTQTDPNSPADRFYAVSASDGNGTTSDFSNRVGVFHFALTASSDAPPPTSYDLIDQALVGGQIDSETAVLYKVYSDFGDQRLPAQYQGDDSSVEEGTALWDAQLAYDTLSPDTRALLDPFFIKPPYPGSWWDLQQSQGASYTDDLAETWGAPGRTQKSACGDTLLPDWECTDAAQANVRVWWLKSSPQNQDKADELIAALDSVIWQSLTGLLQEPLEDSTLPWNAGNGNIDVFLGPGVSTTFPVDKTRCKFTPALIYLRETASASMMAHELMHAIQLSYDVASPCLCRGGEYHWLTEATATWAEDYVYPNANEEHKKAAQFMDHPEVYLEKFGATETTRSHAYGAYLLPFYLHRRYGDPGVVARIWDATQRYDSLAAINVIISGGFADEWPEFTLYNWNQQPLVQYQKWDKLFNQPRLEVDELVDLHGGAMEQSLSLPMTIDHLAARYYRYKFGADARNIVFRNGLYWNMTRAADQSQYEFDDSTKRDGLHITALIKPAGRDWERADWTTEQTKYYCRDVSAERIDELVLIFSDSVWDRRSWTIDSEGEPSMLSATNLGCAGWKGQANYTNTVAGQGYSYTTTSITDVTWQLDPAQTSGGLRMFDSIGTVHWNVSGTDEWGCQLSGSGDIPVDWYDGTLWTQNDLIGGSDYRRYYAGGFWVRGEVAKTCPDGSSTVDWEWEWLPGGVAGSIQAEGTTIEGSVHLGDGDPGGPKDWTWHFTATSEP